jgi:hypothetical protein
MKLLLSYITLLFICSTTQAQTWNKVGSGLPGNWGIDEPSIVSDTSNGDIYVAYNVFDTTTNDTTVQVTKWNGLSWTPYPTLNSDRFYVEDLVVDDKTIYVIGRNIGGSGTDYAFYEFDGTSWTGKAPSGFSGEAYCGEMINGDLYIGGYFITGGIVNFFRYDGSNYYAYPSFGVGTVYVTDILEHKGDIYAAVPANPSVSIDGLKRYNGTSWESPAHFFQGTPTTIDNSYDNLFEYKGDLYVTRLSHLTPELYKVENDTLYSLGTLSHKISDIAIHNNIVFFVGDTAYASLTTDRITTFDGVTLQKFSKTISPPGPSSLAVVDSGLYLFSRSTYQYSGTTLNYAQTTKLGFTSILGAVYNDLNNNCAKDTSELGLENAVVVISDTGQTFSLSTSAKGEYIHNLWPGSYVFDTVYITDPVYKNFKPLCTLPTSLTLGSNQLFVQNLAMRNTAPVDMSVKLVGRRGFRVRHGFRENWELTVSNMGSLSVSNIDVVLEVPPELITTITNPLPSSTSGNKLTFNFSNFQPQETRKVSISARVNTLAVSIGDTINWLTYFDSLLSNDVDSTNNRDTLDQKVVAAYDPNDKHASATTILESTDKIDYHINFQNTGTDTAYKVTIVDTLNLSIPITSVMMNSASHPYKLSVVNNILIWEFDNILLPDSGANYVGSQGYVNFTVNIAKGLAVGDTVKNDAQIYFDYQAAVNTNIAKVVVVTPPPSIGVSENLNQNLISIYPNPASTVLYLKNENPQGLNVNVVDASGRNLDSIKLEPYSKIEYSINKLKPGIYFLNGQGVEVKIIVIH